MEQVVQNNPTKPPRQSGGNALGRSALLVFIAGAAGAGLLLSGIYFAQKIAPNVANAPEAFGAVGIAVAVGTYCWSITLALRALYYRERLFIPLLVLALATIPLGVYGGVQWVANSFGSIGYMQQDESWFGCLLPVLLTSLPLLAIGGLLCARMTIKVVSKRRLRAGAVALTRAQRWKWGLVAVTVCVLIWSVTVAPVASMLSLAGRRQDVSGENWLIGSLPSIYSDTTIFVLEHTQLPQRRVWETMSWYRIVTGGTPSESVLLSRLADSDSSISSCALAGLLRRNPPRARTLAEEMIFNPTPSRSWLVFSFSDASDANKWWLVSKAIEHRDVAPLWHIKNAFTARGKQGLTLTRTTANILLKAMREGNPMLQRFAGYIAGRKTHGPPSDKKS